MVSGIDGDGPREIMPGGNHEWNVDGGWKNYPPMTEENGDLPEPDQVVEKKGK